MSEIPRTEKPIAWVCETVLKGGAVDLELKSNGMTRDEIIENFPVSRSDINLPYNRQKLIEAIILGSSTRGAGAGRRATKKKY